MNENEAWRYAKKAYGRKGLEVVTDDETGTIYVYKDGHIVEVI